MNISPKKSIRRVALVLQYDGSNYFGWQRQSKGITVQGLLEKEISFLDSIKSVKVIGAGRTDSGVHASGQVAHFDTCGLIPPHKWAAALNGRLPRTIRILESVEQPLKWHSCHSATYRRYRYTIYNSKKANLFLEPWSWQRYKVCIDENLMRFAAQELIGCHDFAAFQKARSTRKSSWTNIQDIQIERIGDLIYFEIQASGFLYGMVRLLVGQLVAIGENKLSISLFQKRWKNCMREEVKEAAPAKALCLLRVGYKHLIFSKSASYDTFPKAFLAMKTSSDN